MPDKQLKSSANDGRPPANPMIGMGMGGPMRGMMSKARAKNTKGTLVRLWRYLGRQRKGLIGVIILTVITSVLGLIGPYLIGYSIDKYIIPRDFDGLLLMCSALIAVYVAGAAATWVQTYIMTKVTQRAVWELRGDLFAKLQELPLCFFDTKTHGELMSRTTNDIDNVSNSLNQAVIQLLSGVLMVAGSLIIMLMMDVWLTLLCLVSIPLVTLVTRNVSGLTRKHFSEQQRQLGELNGYIEETVSGHKVVTTFCREDRAMADFSRMNDKLTQYAIKAQIFTGMMGPMMNMINNMSFAILAAGGGWMVIKGMTTVGIVVSFMNYSRQFGRPISEIANQFNMIQSALAGAERVFEIMDTPTEYENSISGGHLRSVIGEVEFRDVHFGYKEDVPVLRDVTLHAKQGETLALVGPTGAGKTTIVNLLTRFYEINSGTVTIDGKSIYELEKSSLRSQLGIVLQDAYVFSDTIRENIRYGKLTASDRDVEEAAKLANADSFIRKLPKGYDTLLTADGGNLSHGQRQLLTIARAILADPAILILDEATSSIDTRTELHIQEAMRKLMKGRTSFVIAHRLSTIREADQILVINGGRIIERGDHHQLLAQKGFYYDLYTSQYRKAAYAAVGGPELLEMQGCYEEL